MSAVSARTLEPNEHMHQTCLATKNVQTICLLRQNRVSPSQFDATSSLNGDDPGTLCAKTNSIDKWTLSIHAATAFWGELIRFVRSLHSNNAAH